MLRLMLPAWLCVATGGHCCHPPPPVEDWGPCCRCGWFVRARAVSRPNVVDGRRLTPLEFQSAWLHAHGAQEGGREWER